jgi:hypothetical protein
MEIGCKYIFFAILKSRLNFALILILFLPKFYLSLQKISQESCSNTLI